MIARLRGKIIEAYPNRLVVDVHGVGYQVFVPLSTFDRLHAAEGVDVDLRTHLHIRETAHTLYGFATEEERDVFLLLIDRVSGIGPAIAMAVLSGMPVPRFKQAVVAGDVAELSRVKGLGKKTAERIVLELKEKLGADEPVPISAAAAGTSGHVTARDALVELG
jgi:holliday junction DNA helicase RuvA